MKKEIQIYAEDKESDGIPESVSILFMADEMPIGGATAKVDGQGNVTEVMISSDLDGDGQIDTSDEQIMKDIATAFMKVKW
ncbi:hypothetical protein [Candidatus Entotheonella palauensis]|uniref:Uncharacterized protein n=1 Tax=Candidatus Entotheonella gemina TaxID=1429439 RepID=W4LV08_9BACT|nr:hypothetical protein [Candidatus Entotheonella palauensis]ETX01556.1 MAG: hypothetical protein ETSY2_36995 [Candidatus Entotheonella gemina]